MTAAAALPHSCRFDDAGRVICTCGWSGTVAESFDHITRPSRNPRRIG